MSWKKGVGIVMIITCICGHTVVGDFPKKCPHCKGWVKVFRGIVEMGEIVEKSDSDTEEEDEETTDTQIIECSGCGTPFDSDVELEACNVCETPLVKSQEEDEESEGDDL